MLEVDPFLAIGCIGMIATKDVKYPTAKQVKKDLEMRRAGYTLSPVDQEEDGLAQKAVTRIYCGVMNIL